MSDLALSAVFVASATVSLASSWVLVSRLERVGARLGLSEALLGMVAALAANAPEITAAVTALATGQSRVGAGVVLGSNVFNLAALLGFAAVVAGRIALHRRVMELQGAVASWVALVAVIVVVGAISAGAGLALALVVLLPYLAALGIRHDRLRRLGLPRKWSVWLTRAIEEEELELEPAIHPRRGRVLDAVLALAAVLVVVGASVAMERLASTLGAHLALSEIVLGGVVLAGVTSLPNAVAAVYLARRGRATATLSTALNSNTLNVSAGLLLPATVSGISASSASTTLVAAWYLGLTLFTLAIAYASRGLRRPAGALIIVAYIAFVVVLAATYPLTQRATRSDRQAGSPPNDWSSKSRVHLRRLASSASDCDAWPLARVPAALGQPKLRGIDEQPDIRDRRSVPRGGAGSRGAARARLRRKANSDRRRARLAL